MKATLLSQHCMQKKEPLKLEVIGVLIKLYKLFVREENVKLRQNGK